MVSLGATLFCSMWNAHLTFVFLADALFSGTVDFASLDMTHVSVPDHIAFHQQISDTVLKTDEDTFVHPHAALFAPIYAIMDDFESKFVGIVHGLVTWDRYFKGLLP